jgi:very-short-patch-repair endonuclease
MDVRLRELAAAQRDLVAAWQLLAVGWTPRMIAQHRVREAWTLVHRGVYAVSYSPLSREQLRMGATLTAPNSFLAHFSAGAHYGIWRFDAGYETIVRPGNRGVERSNGVLVRYSKTLTGDVGTFDGVPITSPERTLIDLAGHADPARALREARRLKLTTPYSLAVSLKKHGHRRGTGRLKHLNDQYAGIPYSRCRSDAEAKALEHLHDAGVEPPQVNENLAGEEADLVWPKRMLIVEIDGPQFHQISAEDARKQGIWEEAGYVVRRISSDDVYARPELLVAASR